MCFTKPLSFLFYFSFLIYEYNDERKLRMLLKREQTLISHVKDFNAFTFRDRLS